MASLLISTNVERLESGLNPPHQQQAPHSGTTFLRTCFNALNTLLGVGILATPYALSQGGWISLTILFTAAMICCYTGLLLQRCIDANPLTKSYPDIAELAFGTKGRLLVSVFLYLELYLVAVELLILEGDNLAKLFPHGLSGLLGIRVGVKQGFIVLTSLMILPTTWLRSLGLLAYFSAGGILATVAVVVSVFWVGAFDGVGFHEKGVLLNLKDMPTAMSLFIFCFGGHAVFPTLYNSMKDKTKFPKVLAVSFVMSTIGYGSMAILGYLMYGEQLNSQVTLNLPVKKLSSQIAIYTTLISPLTKYALIINLISTALEEKLQLHKLKLNHANRLISIIVRTTLVVSTAIVALVVPLFGYVMAFIGSFLIATLSIVLPCLCYLKLNGRVGKNKLEMVMVGAILGLGVVVGTFGTYNSIRNIIKNV